MNQKSSIQNKKNNFSGFNLLLIGMLVLILFMLGYNFYSVYNRSKALSHDIDKYKATSLKKQEILSELHNTNSRIKSILFLHLLTDQDKIMINYQDEFDNLAAQDYSSFAELNKIMRNPEEVLQLKDLKRFRVRLFTQREYFLNLSKKHHKDEAKVYYSRSLYYAYSLYTVQLQNLTGYTNRASMAYYDIIQEKISVNYYNVQKIIAAGVFALIILVILAMRINKRLSKDNTKLNELLLLKEEASAAIKKLNEELETKVIERTKALENTHIELSQQITAVNSAGIVSETDSEGNITFVNDFFCALSGYSREELIGKNHKIFKSGKQPQSLFTNMWETITKGKVWNGLIQNKAKDGSYFWLDSTITPFINSKGEITKFVAIRFDITNQIEQQNILQLQADELSAQSEELRVQQEELHEANTVLSAQTKKLQASEEELKMQHEELMQSNSELEEKSQQIEERNFLINKKNSELQIIADELEKKAEELTQSSKYKSEFLANMSHELRTPLNSILLLSKLLADNNDENLTDDQIEYASVINSSGTGLLELINEILDLSKIEAGKMDVNKEFIPVSYLCKSVDNIFKPLAKNKGIEFISSIADTVPEEILTDRIRVEQVLKNLISNAVKFTEKGKVELRVYTPTPDLLQLVNLPANEYVAFEIIDSGIGIPENKLEHIFEAFQQADGSTQRKYGGTGLGLAISRQIAQLLNGEIKLKSEVGKGSVFTFIIPSKEIAAPVTESIAELVNENVSTQTTKENEFEPAKKIEIKAKEAYLADKALNGKNVLIVDDDNRNIFSLKALLKNQNINITTAGNGKEALNALHNNAKFDLVLMDMMMPEMDGYDTVRELRKHSDWKNLPVIALTAKVMKGDREKCMEAGVSDYLTKPVAGDQLLSLLRVWLYK